MEKRKSMLLLSAFGFGTGEPNWTLFWTAFGALGGTIGAIMTAIAVFVALWQTKYPYKKKLKIKFSDCTRVMTQDNIDFPKLVSLSISNIGNRDIYIQEWGIILDRKNRMKFFPEISSEKFPILIRKSLFPPLPLLLPVEKTATLYFEQKLFLDAILKCVKEKTLKEKDKAKIYVIDSAGNQYYVKTRKCVKQLLLDLPSNQ